MMDLQNLFETVLQRINSMSRDESEASLRRAEEDSADSFLMGEVDIFDEVESGLQDSVSMSIDIDMDVLQYNRFNWNNAVVRRCGYFNDYEGGYAA